MTLDAIEVTRCTSLLPVSTEALADAAELDTAMRRWWTAAPEERAAWAAEAAAARQVERGRAALVPLTLAAVLDKLGWSEEYATHVVQPYCTCGDGYDGWDWCEHARDLGLTP